MISIEIDVSSPRVINFVLTNNSEDMLLILVLLEKRREKAFIRKAKYKENIAKYYNECIKVNDFKFWDLVPHKNEVCKVEPLGKLVPNWEGQYRVQRQVAIESYQLETLEGKALPRIWHVINLRRFFI